VKGMPVKEAYKLAINKGFEKESKSIATLPKKIEYMTSVRRSYMIDLLKEKRLWEELQRKT
jgi:hypothetical protein